MGMPGESQSSLKRKPGQSKKQDGLPQEAEGAIREMVTQVERIRMLADRPEQDIHTAMDLYLRASRIVAAGRWLQQHTQDLLTVHCSGSEAGTGADQQDPP